MKSRKQKSHNANNNTSTSSKKQNRIHGSIPALGKQFQLLYRTRDPQHSSQQYQSVFFLKRKKISQKQAPATHQTSSSKKSKNSRKKKIEEKLFIDEVCDSSDRKNANFQATKSTMPTSTTGMFKKSSFAETFKEKLDLDRSSIKKVNNLSNSNSSRYLSSKYDIKQQKSPKSKLLSPSSKSIPKSPTKNTINLQNNTNSSNKSIDQQIKSSSKAKNIKQKKTADKKVQGSKIKIKNREVKACKNDQTQYVFVDGQYLAAQDPAFNILAQALSIYKAESQKISSTNQLLHGFDKSKMMPSQGHQNQEYKKSQKSSPQKSQQSLAGSQKMQSQREILAKITLIQRWWRSCLSHKALQECNNIKHFPSNAQSESSIPESLYDLCHQQQQQQQQKAIKVQRNRGGVLNFILVREKLILDNMQSQKQILNKMLSLSKITKKQYSESLALIQSNYQKQMVEICRLKQKMQLQAQKAEQLKIKIREKSEIMQRLQKIPTNIILEHFLDKSIKSQASSPRQGQKQNIDTNTTPNENHFNRQKSTGCHYSELIQQKKTIESNKIISYRKSPPAQEQPLTQKSSNIDADQSKEIIIKSPLDLQKHGFENSSESSEQEQHNQPDEQQQNSQNQQVEQSGESAFEHQQLKQMFSSFTDRQSAQAQIEKRYAYQLGITNHYYPSRHSISTSVISIHNFLMNFLKFYEYFYKDEFLKLINLPYGYNQNSRLKILQKYNPENYNTNLAASDSGSEQAFFKVQSIIGQQILQDFHQHSYQIPQNVDDETRAIIYFQKIHHKAVIQCFNQSLNCFRPYYFIGGAPYSWNYSEKALTFYYIAEENIQQVFEKTQYKVLKTASSLCGVICDPLISPSNINQQMNLEQKLESYRQSVSAVLNQNREQKLGKVQKQEVQEFNFKWENFDQEKTALLYGVAQQIYQYLILELLQIRPFGQKSQTCYISVNNIKPTKATSDQSIISNSQCQSESSKQQNQQKIAEPRSYSLQSQEGQNQQRQSSGQQSLKKFEQQDQSQQSQHYDQQHKQHKQHKQDDEEDDEEQDQQRDDEDADADADADVDGNGLMYEQSPNQSENGWQQQQEVGQESQELSSQQQQNLNLEASG